jgi:anti-sigma regulatory factor (Ser/Thr protein kinase)
MMASSESFSETYPAVPESVPLARAALTKFAKEVGASGERLDAVRLAASEAVTNAVMHAYSDARAAGDAGPAAIQVSAAYVQSELWLLIADAGSGLRVRDKSPGLGLGLALIAQLADDLQILSRGTGGTELRMRFEVRSKRSRAPGQPLGSVAMAVSPA